jgi:RNA polymerase sigma-70 factor (ECF subfamily)
MSVLVLTGEDLFAPVRLALAIVSNQTPPIALVPPDEDRALIDRVRNGDRRASSLLFRRHADDVYRRLTRLVGPDPEREDLVQEVFIAAFRGLARFRGDASFSTWLYKVSVHVAYAHLRRRKRRPLDAEDALDKLAMDPELGPEARATQRQQLQRALAFLDRLKPDKRIAFVLREVEGMSLAEIGELVDAKPAAVGQRVKYAQAELTAMIERDQKRRHREERR